MSDINYPERFFYTNEWLYHLSGIWLYNPVKVPYVKRCLQILWTFLVYTNAIYFLILEFLIIQYTIHDITQFFSQFGLLLTHVLGIVRVWLLLSYHQRLLNLQSSLQDKKYYYEAYGEFKPGALMLQAKMVSSICSILVCKSFF